MILGFGVPTKLFGDDRRRKYTLKEWQSVKKNLPKYKYQPPIIDEKPQPIDFSKGLLEFFEVCLVTEKYPNIKLEEIEKHYYLSNEFL